jgi:general secretion pathway protein J
MRKRAARAFTLLEVLVAVAIIALVGVLIYGAFQGMNVSRRNMGQAGDRYQQGRQALERMARELSEAFLSAHLPLPPLQPTRKTAFTGKDDRVDFTAFAHLRLSRNSHESDQSEISYFAARNDTGGLDLARREDKFIDDQPDRGGVVQVLAENIESVELKYLDPLTNEWTDTWDSTQPASQPDRLPGQVWIRLVLLGGPGGATAEMQTKTALPIQLPLVFGIQ